MYVFTGTMGLLQLSNHVVPDPQSGEQITHWDMLNKENSNMAALFHTSLCVICSPVWRLLYHVIAQLHKAHYFR